LERKIVKSSSVIKLGLILVLALGIQGAGFTEETAETAVKVTIKKQIKTVTGEVSAISGNFIAVLYGSDKDTSYEMALNMNKEVKVAHKKSLKDIVQGDTVSVSYEETAEIKEGVQPKVLARVVKEVSFLSTAQKKPEDTGLVTPEQ
jgi:hypothetical protein